MSTVNMGNINSILRLQAADYNTYYQSSPPHQTLLTVDTDQLAAVGVDEFRGPFPGAIIVPTTGIEIPLTGLSTNRRGGPMRAYNKHLTELVTVGVRDPETGRFYAFLDLLPGRATTIPNLSRYLGVEWVGTGTGSGTTPATQMWAESQTEDAECIFDCFDRC